VIGDVSGKGAPAAIYAALVSGILRSHAPIEPAPAEMLSAVNFSLGERRIEAQYICLLYAVWDDQKRTLQVANSGLPRPLFVHDGKMETIEATGIPLGLFDEAEYDEFTFKAKVTSNGARNRSEVLMYASVYRERKPQPTRCAAGGSGSSAASAAVRSFNPRGAVPGRATVTNRATREDMMIRRTW